MTPIEALNQDEKQLIQDYITGYAIGEYDNEENERRASIDIILQPWNIQKQRLFNILGDQLRTTISIERPVDTTTLTAQIRDKFRSGSSTFCRFSDMYYSYINKYFSSTDWARLSYLLSPETLVNNQCSELNAVRTIHLPISGKNIKLGPHVKVMRFLQKLVTYEQLDAELFEQFRLEHSMILNQKNISTTIYLSIHPIDFLTLSDNDCEWTSCMNWENDGDYRRGTVSMMNSDCVICAYMESQRKWHPFGNEKTIPNKRWRQLFICRDDLICSVKAYPYQHDELTKLIINAISDLYVKYSATRYQFGELHDFSYNEVDLITDDASLEKSYHYFTCDPMYCDIGNNAHHFYKVNQLLGLHGELIDYSGPDECLWCGSTHSDFTDESEILCMPCGGGENNHCYCDICGCAISEDEAIWVGDYPYCDRCVGLYFCYEELYGEYVDLNEAVEVFLNTDGALNINNYYEYRSLTLLRDPTNYTEWIKQRYFSIDGISLITLTQSYRILTTDDKTIYYVNLSDLTHAGCSMFGYHD